MPVPASTDVQWIDGTVGNVGADTQVLGGPLSRRGARSDVPGPRVFGAEAVGAAGSLDEPAGPAGYRWLHQTSPDTMAAPEADASP
ncbi:hypothetical protein RKD30_000561 [Streptomyces pristinaespiralis]